VDLSIQTGYLTRMFRHIGLMRTGDKRCERRTSGDPGDAVSQQTRADGERKAFG
jgi:hypothetical protein